MKNVVKTIVRESNSYYFGEIGVIVEGSFGMIAYMRKVCVEWL